jgi:WD40 repeat protein
MTTITATSPFPEACRSFLTVGALRLRGLRRVGREGAALRVAFTPDGRFLLVTGRDGATIWDAARGSVHGPEQGQGPTPASAPSSSPGSMRAAWAYGRTVCVGDLPPAADGAPTAPVKVELAFEAAADVVATAFTADGRSLVALDGSGRFASFSLERRGEPVWTSRPEDLATVHAAVLARDARVAANVSFDGRCVVVYPQTGACLFRLGEPGAVRSVTVSHDGQQVLAGTTDGARLWDMASGALQRRLPGAESDVVALSASGARALGGPRDGRLTLWDVLTGGVRERLDLSPFLRGVHHVAFAPDGRTFVVAGDTRRGLDGSRRREAVLLRFELSA